ncbi:Dut dUTPase [uncultured Caudovirales phage]|uniref:dUTP diphosphatase n=1 Tax=uncultured Caudovirales phage TaxID=2100421 RepID=A0A6J5SWC0_9CAUD|nr:Dut dUTPase [uncultured Caudovirales phage]CAB4219655.1 Dut dUTPase [uncultured Caudovirales phage]
MTKIMQVVSLDEHAALPTKGYHDDAGFDLYVSEETTIMPHSFVDIPLGIAIKLPEGTWGLLTGRSSTLRKLGLLVAQGVIDCGYTGPLFAGVWNMNDFPVTVKQGDRVAQYLIMNNASLDVVAHMVESLPETQRGQSGFGSTGV